MPRMPRIFPLAALCLFASVGAQSAFAQESDDSLSTEIELGAIFTSGNTEDENVKFKATLEAQGWSMSDIVQVRVFGVAGADGTFDFAGFNRGFAQFFGTEENPMKPVRSVVEIAGLVVEGWLVEIEIRAARMPK